MSSLCQLGCTLTHISLLWALSCILIETHRKGNIEVEEGGRDCLHLTEAPSHVTEL